MIPSKIKKNLKVAEKNLQDHIKSIDNFVCSCCGKCCQKQPGALSIKDIDKIAGFLKIPKKELISKYLRYERWNDSFLIVPKRKSVFYGECVFLKQNKDEISFKCTIDSVKPYECKMNTCKKILAVMGYIYVTAKKAKELGLTTEVYFDKGNK